MTLGMLVQIGLCWLTLSLLAGLFYVILRDQRKQSYRRGFREGYSDAVQMRSVKWVDGVPYIPDEEADQLIDIQAARWSDLMKRLEEQ